MHPLPEDFYAQGLSYVHTSSKFTHALAPHKSFANISIISLCPCFYARAPQEAPTLTWTFRGTFNCSAPSMQSFMICTTSVTICSFTSKINSS